MAQRDLVVTFKNRLAQYSDQITAFWLRSFDQQYNEKDCNRLRRELEKLRFDADTFEFADIVAVTDELSRNLLKLPKEGPDQAEAQRLYGQFVELLRTIDENQPAIDTQPNKDPSEVPISGLIYILDDSPVHQLALSMQIELFSYKVISFGNTADLIAGVRQMRPDLIIADVFIVEGMAPDLWLDLFAQLNIAAKDIPPTIFMSAHDVPKVRLKCAQTGGVGFYTKPIRMGRLIEQIDNMLRRPLDLSPRVLVVDDQSSQYEYHAGILQRAGIDVRVCSDPEQAIELVSEFGPNVILMDLIMPEFSGLDIAKAIRQKVEFSGIQILFLSSERNLEVQKEILTSVGDAFLQKPINPDYLVQLVTARAEYARTLEQVMARDALTGLYNHGEIKRLLGVEIQRAQREKTELAVVMLDIDHFKEVNDQHGHVFGDQVIKTLSLMLTNNLRRTDLIGRYGGEEFFLIMPNTSLENAQRVVQIQLEKFSAIPRFGKRALKCTFSAGVANYRESLSRDQLIKEADSLLYQAKTNGRNCICTSMDSPD